MSNLKDTVTTFHYFTKEPRIVLVKSEMEWPVILNKELTAETQAVICIIDNQIDYTTVKRLLACEYAVPSQFVTTQTIRESKHALFTVCCRLLMQLCAKVGGEPWAVSELPYMTRLTTVVGIHVTQT
jgi:hypothetical protein